MRFWSRVTKAGPDECWLWQAARDGHGYGVLGNGAHALCKAHRLSYEIHNGPVPSGMWVLHRCDNPPCVNPAHLFLGTAKDNTADMVAKGRQCHGETLPQAKLTADDVRLIREVYARGNVSQRRLAQAFGVSFGAVQCAITAHTWKHVR